MKENTMKVLGISPNDRDIRLLTDVTPTIACPGLLAAADRVPLPSACKGRLGYAQHEFGRLDAAGLRTGEEQCNNVQQENLEQILFWLRKCGARIFATTLLPIPAGIPGYCRESLAAYNAELKRIADAHDVYTIDAHGFIADRFPAWADGADLALPPEAVAALADQIASAIRFFGAQAVQ